VRRRRQLAAGERPSWLPADAVIGRPEAGGEEPVAVAPPPAPAPAPAPRKSLKRELALSSVGTLVIRGGSLGLGFISTLVLARYLGADGLGIYAWAYALTATLQVLGALGFDRLGTREVAAAAAREDYGRMRSYLGDAPWIVGLFSSTLALVVAAICVVTLPSDRLPAALIALIFLPALALTQVRVGALLGLGKVALSRLPDDLLRPLLFTTTIVIAWHFDLLPETPAAGTAVQAGAIIVTLVAGGLVLRRNIPAAVWRAERRPQKREELRNAVPLMLVNGAAITLSQIDLILVGAICEPAQAGIYALATRVAQLVGLAEYAVNLAFLPVVARLNAQGDMARLQRGAARVAGAGFLMAAAIAVPVILLATPLLDLFGDSFDGAQTPTRLVAISFLISAAAGQNGSLLTMTGRTRSVIVGSVVALISNVGLNAVMIPLWQADGAGIAWVVSVLIWNTWLAVEVHRTMGINASVFGLLTARGKA
jgi:O-antigen/teichoic acid export membrane protein